MKIRSKVAIVILLASLIPAELSIIISYTVFKRAQETIFKDHLEYIASIKEERIQGIIDQLIETLQLIAHRKFLTDILTESQTDVQPDNSRLLTQILESAKMSSETFKNLNIVLPSGNIVASTSEESINQPYFDQEFLRNSLSGATVKTLLNRDHPFEMLMGVPIRKNGDVIGSLIVSANPLRIISTIEDYTGLGQTGETLLALDDGKEAYVFVSPSRKNQKGNVFFFSENDEQLLLNQEDWRNELLYEMVHYKRGASKKVTPVIMATRFLPVVNWGLLIKIDRAEVLEPVKNVRFLTLVVTLVTSLIVIVMAGIFSHSITRPILKLHKVSKKVDDGDLSQRVSVSCHDEIGDLSKSFNTMLDTIESRNEDLEAANDRIQSENKELTAVNKELDNLVHLIGHDLRNPLTTISGFVEIFTMKYIQNIDDEGQMYLEKIRKSSERLNHLIEDLVTLSRVSRQVNPIELFDVKEVIKDILDDMEISIKNNNVEVIITDKLPQIYNDRVKFKIVCTNLISNAVKYSSKDHPTHPVIEVGYSFENGSHTFFVKDNGIGIDPKYHEKIFEIFTRLHVPEEYEGTGAGLSFVKRIIDDLEGEIRVESEVGKGATFFFSIPDHKPPV